MAQKEATQQLPGLAEAQSRVLELQGELDQLSQLHADTHQELLKWKEMSRDLEVQLGECNKKLSEALEKAHQVEKLEEKYNKLNGRHQTARTEFEKLKQVG